MNVPIVNAVMAVADTAQTVGQSKNSRVNAMSAANTAMAGYQAANALSDLAKSGMDSVKGIVNLTWLQDRRADLPSFPRTV